MESFNTAFSIGGVSLTWNAILLAAGILVSVVVSEIVVRKRGAYKDLALDACIVGILTGLIGARFFAALSGKIAFSQFVTLSAPGLNLPGALLFSGIGIALYTRVKKLSLAETFELLLPGAFFGLAVGRWSDFFLCDGLGPVAGDTVAKFFPLVTFTQQYFSDHYTVAYAVFFLDFLVCAALGVAALLLPKRLEKGRTARLTILLYLFAEFILEWLRDGSTRQIVFGGVRFNQIVLMAMLLFFVGLSLYRTKHRAPESPEKAEEPEETEAPGPQEEPETPQEPEAPEEPEEPEAPEAPEAPEEPEEPEVSEASEKEETEQA